MTDLNYGFLGPIPPGVDIQDNVDRAREYQRTHTAAETLDWFYDQVRNNKDGHLSPDQSMDYKQIDGSYADFCNFNFGVIGKALGYPDYFLEYGAGYAQGRADGLSLEDTVLRSLKDFNDKGDNPGDQALIKAGIKAAEDAGIASSDFGFLNTLNEFLKDAGAWAEWVLSQIDPSENSWWQRALSWLPPRRDPLALDLNGNGIETLPANGQVLFDQNGDGIKEGTGWIAPSDGMLVLDRNGNGTIDSGRELFGDNTLKLNGQLAANGFDALKDFDTNADGKIDSSDTQWSQLKIWKDANSDGISQANELFSLNTVNGTGIKQINLANTAGSVSVGNGNIATANGTFVWNDNHVGAAESIAANLNLASNPFYREFPALAIPANKQDLVDMQGSGENNIWREAA